MSTENREFYDLLNSIANEQTFSLNLCPRESDSAPVVKCKQLTTLQLRKLIETVVDNPLTQASFNSAATNVFKESLVQPAAYPLNIIDRLLFILETRAHSLSPTLIITKDESLLTVDFAQIGNSLKQQIKSNSTLFLPSSATEGKVTITYGVPFIEAELQLNKELYADFNPDVENPEELRTVLGVTFVNEIAKSIQSITVEEKMFDFSTTSFKERLRAVEILPANLVQKVINYIEQYKKIVENCLTVDGQLITVDASLFSLR